MAKRIAEVLVESLAEAGVRRIYGVAGDSLNGITDSIRRRDDIAWLHVRHEEAAAFAAGAEAISPVRSRFAPAAVARETCT